MGARVRGKTVSRPALAILPSRANPVPPTQARPGPRPPASSVATARRAERNDRWPRGKKLLGSERGVLRSLAHPLTRLIVSTSLLLDAATMLQAPMPTTPRARPMPISRRAVGRTGGRGTSELEIGLESCQRPGRKRRPRRRGCVEGRPGSRRAAGTPRASSPGARRTRERATRSIDRDASFEKAFRFLKKKAGPNYSPAGPRRATAFAPRCACPAAETILDLSRFKNLPRGL